MASYGNPTEGKNEKHFFFAFFIGQVSFSLIVSFCCLLDMVYYCLDCCSKSLWDFGWFKQMDGEKMDIPRLCVCVFLTMYRIMNLTFLSLLNSIFFVCVCCLELADLSGKYVFPNPLLRPG